MNIKVLQGLNLKSPTTVIEGHLDAQPKTELIDLIKSFHPVFLEDYKVDKNTVIIYSKLPHLWKEILKAINYQSTGDWSEKMTKDYLLNIVIKKQVLSMSTIPILHAAQQMGYEITQFFIEEGITPETFPSKLNRYYVIGAGRESQITISISSSKDSYLAKMSQEDKSITNTVFDRLQLPIAKWELINSLEHLKEVFKKYNKPVVIKPSSLTGGHGVTTNINTLEQAVWAYNEADKAFGDLIRSKYSRAILIQEQVYGEDYRLLVINGVLRLVTKRIPAYIIGDGNKSIKELIADTNKDPRRDKSNPTHVLKPIEFDDSLNQFLKEQSIDLSTIPKKDEKVYVRKVASMSQGGITEDFTDKVHPQIKMVVESLSSSLHAYVLGVDILCKDISKPLNMDNGSIIECNTMPESYLNAFPAIGRQYPEIGRWVIEGLIDINNPTKRIVYIGNDLKKLTAYLKINLNDYNSERIGIYSNKKIYINEEEIKSHVETWKAIEALKINSSLSTIALHYSSLEEVENTGLGFDRIDKLLIEKNVEANTFEGYRSLGLITKIEII